jgi:4-hydroxybenzoyl-CoA reductase subunit beta
MSLPEFQLLRPRSVQEAVQLLAQHAPNLQIIAGGTDLIPSMKQQLFAPKFLMDIRGIAQARGIRAVPGAGVEITRCLWYNQSLAWRKSCDFCLKKDGNFCHVAPGSDTCWAVFSGDTAPALLCLAAEVEIAGPNGYRRLPISQFYGDDGIAHLRMQRYEMLTRVLLPEASSGWKGSYLKLRVRGSIDYPLAGVAVALKLNRGIVEQARVAITGVNPAPLLVPNVDHALIGKNITDHHAQVVGEMAAQVAKPLTTSMLTPEYRREMIRVFTRRAVLAAAKAS